MKVVLPPGEVLVVQIRGSEKLILVETDTLRATVYVAEPQNYTPEKIYEKKFTMPLN